VIATADKVCDNDSDDDDDDDDDDVKESSNHKGIFQNVSKL